MQKMTSQYSMLKLFIRVLLGLVIAVFVSSFIVAIQDNKHKPPQEKGEKQNLIHLDNLQVESLKSSTRPVPDFASISNVIDKKKAFFAYLLPEIRRQNNIVMKERDALFTLKKGYEIDHDFTPNEQDVFDFLKSKYKLNIVDNMPIKDIFDELIIRVDVIPEALILVQAANESGWGTSRFAQNGYNFFGLWCFKRGCGFVPKQRNDGAEHEVAKFRDLSHSVMTYIRNINRLYAYQELRQTRHKLRHTNQPVTAEELSKGLIKYSERGQEYIDELLSMLRVNRKYMSISN